MRSAASNALNEKHDAHSQVLIHDLAPLEIAMKEMDHATGFIAVCIERHPLNVLVANREQTHALILITAFSSVISAYCPYPVCCMVWTFSSLHHRRVLVNRAVQGPKKREPTQLGLHLLDTSIPQCCRVCILQLCFEFSKQGVFVLIIRSIHPRFMYPINGWLVL
jgi:hypothetical protein